MGMREILIWTRYYQSAGIDARRSARRGETRIVKRTTVISIVVCLGIAASAAAGDVWINCAPGFDVFLDGEPAGVSESDENGILIRGIESGDHAIRIEKDGIVLVEFSVIVGFALNQVEVGDLSAKMIGKPSAASQESTEKQLAGTIVITSDPSECNVKIADRRILKKQPILTIPGIPAGEHKLFFESTGTVLSEKVLVQAALTAQVRVDFRNRRVAITAADSDVQAGGPVGEDESPRADSECIEYWIEVLRTNDFEEIEPYQQLLKDLGFSRENQTVITVEDDGTLPIYKLRVGPVPRSNKAKWAAGLIRNAGIPTVWVLPEECQPQASKKRHQFRPDH